MEMKLPKCMNSGPKRRGKFKVRKPFWNDELNFLLVKQFGVQYWTNCGFCGKITKFGTDIP